ncbi:MAG: hypothetical protein WB683_14205 [Candidatus Sulfotelmatobacter sp.]
MNIDFPQELGSAGDAVFASLRAKLAGEVESSAMLADLLQKLNGMQEAQARPADFKAQFDMFVARAEEYLEVVRPFIPALVQFLPAHMGSFGEVSGTESAGLNRHIVGDARALQERRSDSMLASSLALESLSRGVRRSPK